MASFLRRKRHSSAAEDTHLTYNRVVVYGDESKDKDYKAAIELLSKAIRSRQTYKDVDKGQMEDTMENSYKTPATPTDPQLSTATFCLDGVEHAKSGVSFELDDEGNEVETGDVLVEHNKEPEREANVEVMFEKGVFSFTGMKTAIPPWRQYAEDVDYFFKPGGVIESGTALTTTRNRLKILEEKYELFSLLNHEMEARQRESRNGSGAVNAGAVKVDNSVSLRTSMNAKVLVDFIKNVYAQYSEEVIDREEDDYGEVTETTLREVFERENIRAMDLTVEGLGLHPPIRKRFQRFDIFDPNVNRVGHAAAEILRLFISPSVAGNNGRFFASLIHMLLKHREERGRGHAAEYRVPLYGTHIQEWTELAQWMRDHDMCKYTSVRWIVQIPRIAALRAEEDFYDCKTNADQLYNLFYPVMMASLHPDDSRWADVAWFLRHVGGFSYFSDEGQRTVTITPSMPSPDETKFNTTNPADLYFLYYMWANIAACNALRQRLGLNTFLFRPYCGEAKTNLDELVGSYLLADSISQGPQLMGSHVLQYLYIFSQVGVCMSPIANNGMNIPYMENPIGTFYKRGMFVSLNTEEPLHYHHNDEPLWEEYGTAKKLYKLTDSELAEIARNSVIISSFSAECKQHWLGKFEPGNPFLNNLQKSKVSDFRLHFRYETLMQEQEVLNATLAAVESKSPKFSLHGVKKTQQKKGIMSSMLRLGGTLRKSNFVDESIEYPRVNIFTRNQQISSGMQEAGKLLLKAVQARQKYVYVGPMKPKEASLDAETLLTDKTDDLEFNNYYGVYLIAKKTTSPPWPHNIPSIEEFIRDVDEVLRIADDLDTKQVAYNRLQLAEHRYQLHLGMNLSAEAGDKKTKEFDNRDFYQAYKVDVNIASDGSVNARTLLHFFQEKAASHADDVVFLRDSYPITLRQLLAERDIDVKHLSSDQLINMLTVDKTIRDLFLSTENYMGGRYFAELCKVGFEFYKLDAYTFAENRLPVYGESKDEILRLALWFDKYGMASSQNKWVLAIQRRYNVLRRKKLVASFGQYLENIFEAFWEVSLHPGQHPKANQFLMHVTGFDTQDDERRPDSKLLNIAPHDWDSEENPPYNYFLYYFWANIETLNVFRRSRGLCTFDFRPHCGEWGTVDHLVGGYLLANSINHGITITQYPVMEYLFYICQIGLAISPVNNASSGAIKYLENPFMTLFRRGMNVTLATGSPLRHHFTQEPLIEEYSLGAKMWVLSMNDECEIARNSVLQSGFAHDWKESALGEYYFLRSKVGNNVRKSHVSEIRVAFRFEVYHSEINYLEDLLQANSPNTGDSSPTLAGKKASAELEPGVAQATVFPRAMHELSTELKIFEDRESLKKKHEEEEAARLRELQIDKATKIKNETDHIMGEIEEVKHRIGDYLNDNDQLVQNIVRVRQSETAVARSIGGGLRRRSYVPPSVEKPEW